MTVAKVGNGAGAMETYRVRVGSKRAPGTFHIVTVLADGSGAVCDCDGFDGLICSHIDAVLIAGERAMVPLEDHALANLASAAVEGRIAPPSTWQGSWRRDLAWRCLSSRAPRRRLGQSGKPVVCFTGSMPRPRKELVVEADGAGWETVDSPSPVISVLVAADANGKSVKLAYARKNGIPIVALDDWPAVLADGVLPS